MNSQYLILDLYDYADNKICPLYDSSSDVSGQAYNVFIQTERNGWKQLSFDLPAKMQTEDGEADNFRTDLLRSDYRIRSEDEKEVDWFLVNENRITHKAMSKDISVVAGHISQMLKQKNLGLEFSDEDGNNVGTAEELLGAVLAGTGWNVGHVEDFREDDGSVKYRSLKAPAKTGAFKMVAMVADLFEAKPIFHGEGRTVDLIPMNPFTVNDDETYPDVSKADAVVEMHYGVNVSNIQRTIDTENIATKLHVYGSYGDDTYGYCSINECVHTIRNMIITDAALEHGKMYFFELKDDSGVTVKRYFKPERMVYVGDSLIFSFLDPASQMYVWHSPQFPNDEFDGTAYPCYEDTNEAALPIKYTLSEVEPVWTKSYEDHKVTASTQELTMAKNESHHWYFPDCKEPFRIDTFKHYIDSGEKELIDSYAGGNIKFDIELENPANETYTVEIIYKPGTLNYTLDEVNDVKDHLDLIIKTGSVRLAAVNWMNFLMNFNYYRRNGTLEDQTVKTIAEYQTRAPEYYREAHDASLKMSEDITELNKYIGTANFCKLSIAGVDPTPDKDAEGTLRERLRIDKSEEHPDGVLYRSDYYITNKSNYFKWTGVPKLTEDGRPESGVASVLYVVHDTDPITWDRAFLYDERTDNKAGVLDNPDYLILHAEPGKISVDVEHDKFFLFQSLTGGGYLATYESMEEAAVKALTEALKEATYEHPVYFGTVAPDEITDREKAVRTKLGDYADIDAFLGQEYSWYWQYDERGEQESKMYFCYKDAGDEEKNPGPNGKKRGIYFPVYYQSNEPISGCKEREYWFDYKTSKLYRFTDGEWELLDNSTERAIGARFGVVHQQCMRRDLARNGMYEKYTYTVPENQILPRGNYYIDSGKNTAWITSTTKDLPGGSKLTYYRRQNAVYQISGTSNVMLNTKAVNLDAVAYHAQNLVSEGAFIQGWILDDGGIDDSDPETCYTRASMYCYPNTEYQVNFVGLYDFRIVEYTESNSNKRFIGYKDYHPGDIVTFTTGVNTNYLRMCVKAPAETVNDVYLPLFFATCKDRAFVTEGVNFLKLDDIEYEGDLAGVRPSISKLSEYGDIVYEEDYGTLKSAQAAVDSLMQDMNEELGDMLREGYWQDNSYVDGDEAKLYADALKKLSAVAEPEIKYTIRYIDNREAIEDEDYYAMKATKGVKWPWITTETAVHLLDPEIGVDVWAYVDKVNRCYTDPRKTTISINTNLSTITQHTFGDVLSNIAEVANETRTSSVGGLRRVNEGVSTVSSIAAAYQQQFASDATALSSTISSLRTIITGIQDNYITGIALEDYSTIQQTSDAITSTVTSIQKEINGGANLIKESNFFLYKTNLDTESVTYRLDLAEEYTTNIFINQYLTLSYYLESIGDRSKLVGGDSPFDNYFGAGLVVVWGSNNNAGASIKEDKIEYYMFDMCEAEGKGRRVAATAQLTPPEEGYDAIKDMYVSVQLTAKPDPLNDNTWAFGQPQLEVGKFCTGYKESAFEIKEYAQSQLRQTAEVISAQIEHLTEDFNKATKVSITEDGIVVVAQSTDSKTVEIDPDPYAHPVEQWAVTASPAIVPVEQEWHDSSEDSRPPEGSKYVWYRSVVISNGTIVSATNPMCIDAALSGGTPILLAQDQYCYVNFLNELYKNQSTQSDQGVIYTYEGDFTWSLNRIDPIFDESEMQICNESVGASKPIKAGDAIEIEINKDEDPGNNVHVVARERLKGGNIIEHVDDLSFSVNAKTATLYIGIKTKPNVTFNNFKISVIMHRQPTDNDEWFNEYRGKRKGYGTWVRTYIQYNDDTHNYTNPVKLDTYEITNVNVQYAALPKGEQPDENTIWKSNLNGVINASQVIWTRVEYAKLDGSKTYSDPTILRQNSTASIESVETYYYNSSNSALLQSEINNYALWSKTEECESGKSLWARNKVIFSDGTVVWCAPQICSAYNALFLQEDMTIGSSGIEVRYALSDSSFVPPGDNENWTDKIPQIDNSKPEYKNIWFSVWTWCKNGKVYRSIPVYLTDTDNISGVKPVWMIIDGFDMPNNSALAIDDWATFDDKSYLRNPNTSTGLHMWVCIKYTYKPDTDDTKQCISDVCRARYYDNLFDGGYDVHKSREELLNDRYVRELYAAKYDENGNTIESDINKLLETAQGTYRYLLSDDNANIEEYTASGVYQKLTSDGAISEINRRADKIVMAVGGIPKNQLHNSAKIEVVDWEKKSTSEPNEPTECATSSSFTIDNLRSQSGTPVQNITSSARISVEEVQEQIISTQTKSKNIIVRGIDIFNTDYSADIGTYQNVSVQNVTTVNGQQKGTITFKMAPFTTYSGSSEYDVKIKVLVYVNNVTMLDTGFVSILDTDTKTYTINNVPVKTPVEGSIGTADLTFKAIVRCNVVGVKNVARYIINCNAILTYIETRVTGYSTTSATIGTNISLNELGVTGYSISGTVNRISGEDLQNVRIQIFKCISPNNQNGDLIYEYISGSPILDEDSNPTGNISFYEQLDTSIFPSDSTYNIVIKPVYEDRKCLYELSNVSLQKHTISTIHDVNIPITGTLAQGSKYIIKIAGIILRNEKSDETQANLSCVDIGIPKTGDSTSYNIIHATFPKDARGMYTGTLVNFTYTIDSLERAGKIIVYAGQSQYTQGKLVQLDGVSIIKFPRYKSEGSSPASYMTEVIQGTDEPFILSIGSIINNDYTYGGTNEDMITIRNKLLLDNIAVDKVMCEILRRKNTETTFSLFNLDGDDENASANSYMDFDISNDIQYVTFKTDKTCDYVVKLYANTYAPTNKRGGSVTFKEVQLEEIDEENEIDPETNEALPTKWKPAIGEASAEFSNSAILINEDGIKATGGTIDIQAGSSFNVGSNGTVTINSASEDSSIRFGKERIVEEGVNNFGFQSSFEVTADGELYAKTGYFDEIFVDGVAITPSSILRRIDERIEQMIREYFVRAITPDKLPNNPPPSHGYYWMKEDVSALSGDIVEHRIERHYDIAAKSGSASGSGEYVITLEAKDFPSISRDIKSVGYIASFSLKNNTSELASRSMWINSIRVYAEGVEADTGATNKVLVLEKTYSPHYVIGYYGKSIDLELSTPSERNVVCGGYFKLEVHIFVGNEKAYYDKALKLSWGQSGYNITVLVPPIDKTVTIDNVTAFPYEVYYIPPYSSVVAPDQQSSSSGG